ncbi:MAG: GDP-mannose 4,6-dehydratase [Caldilineales bacterium]|nr:GDP-mannose 4,6-dehydratase [Caldilineales bacterium]
MRGALAQARPQVVYHLASLVTARQEIDLVLPKLFNNLVGTVHLFLALAEIGCQQVVTTSSSEEPTDEVPTSPYAAAKAGARFYAGLFQQTYGLPITVAKLFMAYGPRQRPDKLISYLVLSCLRGQSPQLSSGARVCDLVYVRDVVRGLLKIGLRPNLAGQTIELGTGRGVSIREAALLAAELSGSKVQPIFGAVADRMGERPRVADLASLHALLDWTPQVCLEDGLRDTIEWYRATL